jgi:hypothetical protein
VVKKARYIILTLIIFILVSSIAATCNMCGIPFQTDVEEGERLNPGQPQGSKIQQVSNNPPTIDSIEISGISVEFMNSQGYFDKLPSEVPEGAAIVIDVEASDRDGDEIQYRLYDNLGIEFGVLKIDNNHAEITWIVPAHSGSYTLTLEVSDGRGGADNYIVDTVFQ